MNLNFKKDGFEDTSFQCNIFYTKMEVSGHRSSPKWTVICINWTVFWRLADQNWTVFCEKLVNDALSESKIEIYPSM